MLSELIERLSKCPDFSCSRCSANGTQFCAIKEAVLELKRFDQVINMLNKERGNLE